MILSESSRLRVCRFFLSRAHEIPCRNVHLSLSVPETLHPWVAEKRQAKIPSNLCGCKG